MISASIRAALVISRSIGLSVAAKATLLLFVAFVGARAARRVRASVRHVWWASIFAALLALPSVALLMPAIVIPVSAGHDARPISVATLEGSSPTVPSARLLVGSTDSEVRSSRFGPSATWVEVGWLLGTILTLMPVAGDLVRLRAIRRTGRRWSPESEQAYPARLLLHDAVAVPMTAGFRRPIVMLPPDAPSWDASDLRRTLAHECAHVRRNDWLVHGIARVVCSFYWFHPLAWAAWRHLRLEAERACDDAVLESDGSTTYADQLVRLARRLSGAPAQASPAIVGPRDLWTRVSAVLDDGQSRGPAGLRASIATAALAMTVLGLVSPLRATEQVRTFTAASVTADTSGTLIFPRDPHARISTQAGGICGSWGWIPYSDTCLYATSLTLQELAQFAYGGSGLVPPLEPVVGGPSWMATRRFDIVAHLAHSGSASPLALPDLAAPTQALLNERFRLTVHREARTLPIYDLVLAHSNRAPNPHLRAADARCTSAAMANEQSLRMPARDGACSQEGGDGYIHASAISMPQLASMLANRVHGVVRDRTELAGRYAINLTWTVSSSFEEAVLEQLGLALVRTTGPVEVLVIDRASSPSIDR